MADYDFSTLNSSDFEELVCDLLNAHEGAQGSEIFFKTFKEGKRTGEKYSGAWFGQNR
jgi:hypothetical protein